MRAPQRPRDMVLSEFEATREQHRGHIRLAAPMLGMTHAALARALYRAKRAGIPVRFTDSGRSP